MPDWSSSPGGAVLREPVAAAGHPVLRPASFNGAWDAAAETIGGWAALAGDWDGDGAEAPAAEVLRAAAHFAGLAQAAGVPDPRPSLAADGEVSLRWSADRDAFATVSFLPDGHVVAYCTGGRNDRVPLKVDCPYHRLDDPGPILAAIKAVG